MKRLSRRWDDFRRNRIRSMIERGASPKQASRLARLEAEGRQRIARSIGDEAAEAGRLIFPDEGTPGLEFDLELVPLERRQAVSEFFGLLNPIFRQ